jgi:hypothetical protein
VDSKDVKFNETFSDCRDKKGKIIEGGRVLDPDLLNLPPETEKTTPTKIKEKSRFAKKNLFSEIDDDSEEEQDNEFTDDEQTKEVEIEINDEMEEIN